MILDEKNKVAYLEFPAKPEEVREATAMGYQIIDVLFAPNEIKNANGGSGKGAGRGKGAGKDKEPDATVSVSASKELSGGAD